MSNGQKQKQETNFIRFILLGVSRINGMVAFFTYSQIESADLLQYCNHLTPGRTCAVIRAKFENKYMGSVSTTPILATCEPLVPLKLKTQPIVNSPRMVSSPDCSHFYIECRDLTMNNIDAISPNSVFCDGQPKGDCPCLEIENRKTSWVLTAEVQNQELHHPTHK